jgi:hypothetical protein
VAARSFKAPLSGFGVEYSGQIAAVHQVEYLLTWNCKHIANVEILPRIADILESLGLELPMICTPEELLGVEDGY